MRSTEFVTTIDREKARRIYENVLGLCFQLEHENAMFVDYKGTRLHI